MEELLNQIKNKQSFLCVGLDFTFDMLKGELPIEVCKRLIDQTIDRVVVYKINLAFFELLEIDVLSICSYIKQLGGLIIIDGKRGDIDNTSKVYAKTIYDKWNCDGTTLNPYMGEDSLKPFFEYSDKFSIVLGLTSNKGVSDFQKMRSETGLELWEEVISSCLDWKEDVWFVMGGNRTEEIKKIRQRKINNFLLVPGLGHQGGDLINIIESGITEGCGLIINASRSVIASDSPKKSVELIANQMHGYL